MIEVGANKGRDVRLEVRRNRTRKCRDIFEDAVVWLYFMTPHLSIATMVLMSQLLVSVRANSNVHTLGAPFRLPEVVHHGPKMACLMPTSALWRLFSRLRFIWSMTTIPSLWRDGAHG
jgi:hypothetical protein